MTNIGKKFERLVDIMKRLRGPGGCPWDKEQTYKDISAHTIEEAYEVADTIDRGAIDELREELGDLLLQVVFHARIAEEEGRFDIEAVLDAICEKLIRRHPHVFGSADAKTSVDVVRRWESIKQEEGRGGLLEGVPPSLPALLKAFRMGEKVSRGGFDWPRVNGILDKIQEEIRELHDAYLEGDIDAIRHEYGDLLFTIANLGRFLKIDPEGALREAANRFSARFSVMEEMIKRSGRWMQDLSMDEWDKLWQKAKGD